MDPMALARKYQIVSGQSCFVHCYSRCVRRAFLCGFDPVTNRDYSHRRQWIVDRLSFLSRAFAIDVYAYAIMDNHWHVVLHVEPNRTANWSDEEVSQRWRSIYEWRQTGRTNVPEDCTIASQQKVKRWRERLGSVSWFMKSVNEPLARIANAEDKCKGHFWEGRFGSTVLLDDPAVLAAMAYVDLNPIKAGITKLLEESDFTSIKSRLESYLAKDRQQDENPDVVASLMPMSPIFTGKDERSSAIGTTLIAYIELLQSTIRPTPNRVVFPPAYTPKLKSDSSSGWRKIVSQFDKLFTRFAGSPETLNVHIRKTDRKRRIDLEGSKLLASTLPKPIQS